jgi:hypothetical protein
VRPPRVRASACPLVSVSTAACACPHRRAAVRVPSPHAAVSTLAAAPAVAQRRGVLGIVRSTPSRARALCVPSTSLSSTPRISCFSQVFRQERAERHDPRRAVGAQAAECPVRPPCAHAVRCRLACAQSAWFTCGRHGWASRAALGYAAPWVPPAACGLQGGRQYCLRTPR